MAETGFGVNELNIIGQGNPLISTPLDLQISAANVAIGSTVTITAVSDIYTNSVTVGTALTCNFSQGSITRTVSTNIATINIDNVPTTSNRVHNYVVLMNPSATMTNLSSVVFQINGSTLNSGGDTLRWLNSLPPSGTSTGYYLLGFTILRLNTSWEVLGVFASYA